MITIDPSLAQTVGLSERLSAGRLSSNFRILLEVGTENACALEARGQKRSPANATPNKHLASRFMNSSVMQAVSKHREINRQLSTRLTQPAPPSRKQNNNAL